MQPNLFAKDPPVEVDSKVVSQMNVVVELKDDGEQSNHSFAPTPQLIHGSFGNVHLSCVPSINGRIYQACFSPMPLPPSLVDRGPNHASIVNDLQAKGHTHHQLAISSSAGPHLSGPNSMAIRIFGDFVCMWAMSFLFSIGIHEKRNFSLPSIQHAASDFLVHDKSVTYWDSTASSGSPTLSTCFNGSTTPFTSGSGPTNVQILPTKVGNRGSIDLLALWPPWVLLFAHSWSPSCEDHCFECTIPIRNFRLMVSQSLVRIRSVFMLACYTQSTTSNRVFDLAKLLPLGSHAPAVPSFVGPSSCALDGHCHSVVSFCTNAFVDASRPWGVVLLLMATYLWGEFASYIQACIQATILRVDLFSSDPLVPWLWCGSFVSSGFGHWFMCWIRSLLSGPLHWPYHRIPLTMFH